MSEQSADQTPALSQSSKAKLSKSPLAAAFDIGGLMMLIVMVTSLPPLILGVIAFIPRQLAPVFGVVMLLLPGAAFWLVATGVAWAVGAITSRLPIAVTWVKVMAGAILGGVFGLLLAAVLGLTWTSLAPLVPAGQDLAQWADASVTIGVPTALAGMFVGVLAVLQTNANRPTA
jgi:hypothetical protein